MSVRRIGIISQLVPPEPTWTATGVPDQTGKVVIITGGNRGIGKETARVLLSKGAKVYIATRSEEKAQSAIADLKQATGKDSLDLADLLSVKTAADEFVSKESELHTLYNNAGVMYTPVDKVTSQGYDLQFGTNVLGHFYLTKLLLPVLTATAKKSPAKTVRVVNVSSIGHYLGAPEAEGIRWSTLAVGGDSLEARKGLGSARLFGQSKMGNIFFSNELARRYGAEGIVSISLHPGTDLSHQAGSLVGRVGKLLKYAFFYVLACGDLSFLKEDSPAMSNVTDHPRASATAGVQAGEAPSIPTVDISNSHGATTSLYAGTAPDAGELNGRYLTAWARVTFPHYKALNTDTEKKLWDWCEDQVKDIDNKAAA